MKTPIEQAAAKCGGVAELARRINRAPAFVHQMKSGRRPVPPALVLPIEAATGGEVTRYELRPDIFGPAPGRAA